MKRVVILGSTGSIGINTLKVIARYDQEFEVLGLSAYNNVELLKQQARETRARFVAVRQEKAGELRKALGASPTKVLTVEQDLPELVAGVDVDIVVVGMSGRSALEPFLSAVRAGKRIAPANKEALVIAGKLIQSEAAKSGAEIIPVDSEQSAIFQSLQGSRREDVDKVFLTASGGSLRQTPAEQFDTLTVEDILAHPRWKMGKKITVDSATMINKGFEIIEAIRLFDLSPSQVEVVIHPEAIIHSMVGFRDGSVIAQLSETDMRVPIQYALTYPKRQDSGITTVDLCRLGQLTFHAPDSEKFPCLTLAREAAQQDGTLPSVLNAADEIAVEAFLNGKLRFSGIYSVIEKVMRNHRNVVNPGLQDILDADQWAREQAQKEMGLL